MTPPPPDPREPERLALFGDVHANLPALQAVLAAIRAACIARGACTGDLVMRGAAPEGCVAAVRALGWPCVMGNTDRRVGRSTPDPGHPKAERMGSRAWTAIRVSADSRRFLADLPMTTTLTLGSRRVVVMHGTPEDPREPIDESTPDDALRRLAAGLRADVVVSGHTHRAAARWVDHRLFVNPGSVGEGVPADRRPSWAVLEAGDAGLEVRFMRVEEPLATVRRDR